LTVPGGSIYGRGQTVSSCNNSRRQYDEAWSSVGEHENSSRHTQSWHPSATLVLSARTGRCPVAAPSSASHRRWTEGEAAVSAGTLPTGRAEKFERTLHEASMLWIVIQTVWTLSTASNGSMGRMSDLGGEHAFATRHEQRNTRLTTPAAPEHIRADMSVRVAVRMDRRPGKGTANRCQKESGDLTPRRRSKTADALVPARSDDEGHFRRVDRISAAETKPECKDLSLGV
jgi:hypothetical protein